MIRILVTGAKGQLAKTLKELLETKQWSQYEFVFCDKGELDITSSSEVDSFFESKTYDFCINCAAYTNVEKAEDDIENAFAVNAEALIHLSDACKRHDTTLIHVSTDYVFDGEATEPYTESDKTNPINQYGKSKLFGENHIRERMDNYFIIRTSWLYSRFEGNFVNTIISKLKEGSTLNITDSQKGTPTSCTQLSEFVLFLIKSECRDYGIYHLSGIGETSWYGFACEIASYFEGSQNYTINRSDAYVTKADRPKYSVMNNQKAQRLYQKILPWQDQLKPVVWAILKSYE